MSRTLHISLHVLATGLQQFPIRMSDFLDFTLSLAIPFFFLNSPRIFSTQFSISSYACSVLDCRDYRQLLYRNCDSESHWESVIPDLISKAICLQYCISAHADSQLPFLVPVGQKEGTKSNVALTQPVSTNTIQPCLPLSVSNQLLKKLNLDMRLQRYRSNRRITVECLSTSFYLEMTHCS